MVWELSLDLMKDPEVQVKPLSLLVVCLFYSSAVLSLARSPRISLPPMTLTSLKNITSLSLSELSI